MRGKRSERVLRFVEMADRHAAKSQVFRRLNRTHWNQDDQRTADPAPFFL